MHSKSQFYLSQCIEAASKSPMAFTLGSVIVKGGKVISTGYNHQRVHYDELSVDSAFGKPVSMHAEMHAIYNLTGGRSPPFKQQVQPYPCPQPHKRKRQAGGGDCHAAEATAAAQRNLLRPASRRCRFSKITGADLYVVRTTKSGMGCARPCWRCIDWCDWAGIKRIFHWSESDGTFCCLKVADAKSTPYETQADVRLFGGALRSG
ncbi:uncharacterized protein BT62DRAFT_953671 [Guyanagaster necrorhizus]|uniref:CMP/dCMP-type deaminase domain-containing protein n=1 Tax=Guyanagaster necrorhizus TaxID=856835 RepID=A0A9P7VNR3_9AGAR|nr:uncharacterized protein BT62DRAFT_953671 [Guyanagaster necrorhizus MCA 3950]KAG7443219.1 hypothetical protein BT62DRAFT_953671 [Guyanagaster necrorhizus MCA 3950]